MWAAVGILAVAAQPSPAEAADGSGFALTSKTGGGLRMSAAAGQTRSGVVFVSNRSKRPITVVVKAADIRTATNGNADYVTSPKGTGRWLTLAASKVRLAPGTGREIAFTAHVPAGTTGASHYAGIVAMDASEVATAARTKRAKGRAFRIARINRQALPITIRLPGSLKRRLDLQSVKIAVQPVGAQLVLGMLPAGGSLIGSARVKLRVSRGAQTLVKVDETLGQLFPGSKLDYRIAWPRRPTTGDYHVVGEIRPKGAAVVRIDRHISFTAKDAAALKRETPPAAGAAGSSLPVWVWVGFTAAGLLLLGLIFAVYKLARRAPVVETAA